MPVALPSLADSEYGAVVCAAVGVGRAQQFVDCDIGISSCQRRHIQNALKRRRKRTGDEDASVERGSGQLVRKRHTPIIAGHRRSAVLRGAVRTTSLALRRVRPDPGLVVCAGLSHSSPSSSVACLSLSRSFARSLAPERTAPASVDLASDLKNVTVRVGRTDGTREEADGRGGGDGCREPSSRRQVTVNELHGNVAREEAEEAEEGREGRTMRAENVTR